MLCRGDAEEAMRGAEPDLSGKPCNHGVTLIRLSSIAWKVSGVQQGVSKAVRMLGPRIPDLTKGMLH